AGGAPARRGLHALQQVVVAGTMARRVTEIRAGGPGASAAGDALARDAVVFTQVLTRLMQGNDELGIAQVRNPAAQAALQQSQEQWNEMRSEEHTSELQSREN